MKRVVNFLIGGIILISASVANAQQPASVGFNQKSQPQATDRMSRDIAVAENVLSTLIKQELDQRSFFFMEVKGNYISGYGVTFTVPTGMLNSNVWTTSGDMVYLTSPDYDYAYESNLEVAEEEQKEAEKAMNKANKEASKSQRERNKAEQQRQSSKNDSDLSERQVLGTVSGGGAYALTTRGRGKRVNTDSLNAINNGKVIDAARNFIADYGDMLSQLTADERIVVTNRGNGESNIWFNGQRAKRSLISVEARKGDLTDFRQGKLTREQLLAKMKVVNTVSSEKSEPDMELLASIFNRLYRSDLSRTYYVQSDTYYERLNDFGVILHMQVVSSVASNNAYYDDKNIRLTMPTVGLQNLTQEERDKKVKELYPVFESELKENILDYGRTLKSLKDTEQLMVNVTMTKCKGCGIPATLELAVKASVLKDFNTGKLDKSAALSKIEVKKGAAQ